MLEWEDMTDKFKQKIIYAMIQYVNCGETQPIVDIVSQIQEEAFEDGYKYALENINDICER